MPSYSKKHNFICYTKNELFNLIKIQKGYEMISAMLKNNFTFNEVKNDPNKMEQIVGPVSNKLANDRDEHEIIFPLFSMLDFYKDSEGVCFSMRKGFDPNKNQFNTLQGLINARSVDADNDFIIQTKKGFIFFQLKRYRGELNNSDFFNFIKEKMQHYGNNLGFTNLLIIPQAKPYSKFKIDFYKLHADIKSLDLKSESEILLTYNEMNKNNVIIRLYPKLSKMSLPFTLPSKKF